MNKKKNHTQDSAAAERLNCIAIQTKIHLLFMALLSIGFLGFWIFWRLQRPQTGLIFAHTAALGMMGFYGSWAGALAGKKGYGLWKAFSAGFFLPIVAGFISVIIYNPTDHLLRCGGWEALGTGLLVVIFVFFLPKA